MNKHALKDKAKNTPAKPDHPWRNNRFWFSKKQRSEIERLRRIRDLESSQTLLD